MPDLVITFLGRRIENTWRQRVFDKAGHTGWGYSFDVSPDGLVILKNSAQSESYRICEQGVKDGTMVDKGIKEYHNSYYQHSEGLCPCGETVVLDGGGTGLGNSCECGRMYNMSGDLVKWIDEAGFEAEGGYSVAGERW
jgi:hypothetical protein